ncbi:MAG: peptidoglycan DD-metalloendopeptidase family protein [Proteobacteria bacterium]|nr:peptidoglycan DD-metalloendopeptidase family protein [Pseudomonadota bacterium]
MLCALASCSSGYRAPVEDRHTKSRSAPPSVYNVQRGDTLYSITWRYGLDYRTVASANGISSPYTIYPGQKLYLKKKAPSASRSTAVKPSSTQPTPGKSSATTKAVPRTTTTSSTRSSGKSAGKPGATVSTWRWPTAGKVTRGYSSTVHKGIDIAGKRGDAIVAVAAGRVVYAGAGIVGYGELLIIKHNEIYLSAYGHNYRLLVKEGEQVKAGQKIAEKGSSGTDTVKLHFEIRKEGKPVDPQKLLP